MHRAAAMAKDSILCIRAAVGAHIGLQQWPRAMLGAPAVQWVQAKGCSIDQGQYLVHQSCSRWMHRAAAMAKDSVLCIRAAVGAHRAAAVTKDNVRHTRAAAGGCTELQQWPRAMLGAAGLQ